ncbi:unnamed protein product [Microthlaspi erraticum]|uniref:Response regulatory domain-containing protein n=1 Tax=Microthlaspi erraticum TaxID=1685480 RepID=A0A6D2LHR1_9BRAS|nr:unnamed protein product [Microthlaspi erraticum]
MRLVEWKEAFDPNNPANSGVIERDNVQNGNAGEEKEERLVADGSKDDNDDEEEFDDMKEGDDILDLAEERNALTEKKRQPLYRKGYDVHVIAVKKESLLTGKKIIVVDDNIVNRGVAAGALKKFGAEVVCAESSQVALGLLQIPHSFDACFMDIQMPQMDG